MDSEVFYATAATVIPLLLISVIATRSWRPGELQRQSTSALLIFGIPIIGEVAAFAFLFVEPMPPVPSVILSILTWAGLLSQLGLATWWLTSLISSEIPKVQKVDSAASTTGTINKGKRFAMGICPMCGKELHQKGQHFCRDCSHVWQVGQKEVVRASINDQKLADRKGRETQGVARTGAWREIKDALACPLCHASLQEEEETRELVCTSGTCGLAYPLYNDRPILLIEAARRPGEPSDNTSRDGANARNGDTIKRASELPGLPEEGSEPPPGQA